MSSIPPSSPPSDFPHNLSDTESWQDTDNDDDIDSDDIPLAPPPTKTTSLRIFSPRPLRTPLLSFPLAPSSDPGIIPTSPVTGRTPAERAKKNREKAARKRRTMLSLAKAKTTAHKNQTQAHTISSALRYLRERSITIMDLMVHVFDPSKGNGATRWEFFRRDGNVSKILDFWVSARNSSKGREDVSKWAIAHVVRLVGSEARKITQSGILQSIRTPITVDSILGFDFQRIFTQFKTKLACTTTEVFQALAVAPRRLKTQTEARERRTQAVVTTSILAGLGEYSHANNFSKRLMALYLFATGTSRQVISTLSRFGTNESYSNLIAKDTRSKKQREKEKADREAGKTLDPLRGGTLKQLSDSARTRARSVAAVGIYGTVYDNINMTFRNAEQIIGRHDTQENGTCATIWPLRHAKAEDMKLLDFLQSFDNAPPLSRTDILHTEEEAAIFRECLIHCILRIIVTHGGDGFKPLVKPLEERTPRTGDLIDLSEGPTKLYPLPAFEIDESTIVGNAEVDSAIVNELRVRNYRWFWERVRIIAGDQLSLARLRAIFNLRAGKEGGYASFGWGVWMPGLFHGKIADMHGMFATHWGKPNCGHRNPGCLAFHNTQLNRLPISPTSLPTFRTCRDLVFVSLYARVLHCLLIVSNSSTLEECSSKICDFESFYSYGNKIYEKFTNAQEVSKLRWERSMELAELNDKQEEEDTPGPRPQLMEGDMVYENAILFMHDALISREFTDAVKCGDSGRVLLVLKIWALSFRGNGRSKYAYEMLHIIHNLTHVWPKGIRKIVLDNWLLNPSGHPNSWVEVDLVQEHMNFWIKSYYKAQGSNASWEWLEMVAPCVQALRHITGMVNGALGIDIGSKHSTPDLFDDISKLMESLEEHKVYRVQKGRVLDEDDPPVADVVSVGLQCLSDVSSNPLDEYNRSFARLQARRRMTPIVNDTPPEFTVATAPQASRESSTRSGTSSSSDTSEMSSRSNVSVEPSESLDTLQVEDIGDDDYDRDLSEDQDEDMAFLDDEDEPTLERLSAEDVSLDMDDDVGGFDLNVDLNEEYELYGGDDIEE